jgi:predicted nucleic acid-binding protein
VLLSRLDPELLPEEPLITAVTLAELSVGPLVATTRKERLSRQAVLQQTEADFESLSFDAESARAFGRVAASLRAAGRMIAATAIANGLPLYSVNAGDFSGIDDLDLRPIPHPGQQ